MILRKSFLADSIENFKRRNWVFWLQFLSFFCAFPGILLLELNSISSSNDDPIRLSERMFSFTDILLGTNVFHSILVVGLAILAGIQGFSYLHDKKQVNFYHSQPVSRNRRFLVIWLNGIISFLAAYIVNVLLGMAVAASFGCMSSEIAVLILQAIWANLLLFLSIYHVAILAVMLTGYTLVSLIGIVVILFYEVAAKLVYFAYSAQFFKTYSHVESEKITDTILSPIITFFAYLLGGDDYTLSGGYTYGETMFSMAGLALFFGLAGWLLYRIRPSESHGKSISFTRVKKPLKLLLLLLVGSLGGLAVHVVSGNNEILGIGGVIFSILIGHAVIELIYEVDFRAIKKSLPIMGLSLVLVTFIFVVFRWDIFHYDDKIPNKNKVESVALFLNTNYWDNSRVLPDGTEVNASIYWRSRMEITDIDMVYRLLDGRVSYEEYSQDVENELHIYPVDVVFKLKNGKVSNRLLFLDYENSLEVMNEIYHLEEYQKNTNQLMEDNFVKDYNIYMAEYDNGLERYKVPGGKVEPLLEAYVKDINHVNFAELCYSSPIGSLNVGGHGIQDEEYINEWWVAIYPEFTNTVALLKQEGIRTEAVCDQAYLDRVMSINIHYTDVAAWNESKEVLNREDYHRRLVFVNKENQDLIIESEEEIALREADEQLIGYYIEEEDKLKEILDNCIVQESIYWRNYPNLDEDNLVGTTYQVVVNLSPVNNQGYSYSDTYYFKEGQIPEFIVTLIEEASGE